MKAKSTTIMTSDKMNIRRTSLAALSALSIIAASAQDLSTEITVDRTVLPEQKQATRPSQLPVLLPLPEQKETLSPAEYAGNGTIANQLAQLPPAPWRYTVPHTPYKGYFSAGYFPELNIGATAGYRFLDTDKAMAGIFLQYLGHKYNRDIDADSYRMKHDAIDAGAYGSYAFGKASRLSLSIGYDYSSVAHPLVSTDPLSGEEIKKPNIKANGFNAKLGWESQINRLAYDASADLNLFAFGKLSQPIAIDMVKASLKQTATNLHLGAGIVNKTENPAEKHRWAGIDLNANILSTSVQANGQNALSTDAGTQALVSLHPYLQLIKNSLQLRAGLGLSLTSWSNSTKFAVAPEVIVSYAPESKPFAAFFQAKGGQRLNPLFDMYALDPYLSPYYSYAPSKINFDLEAGFTLGRFAGFALDIYGGYAQVRNWYMPSEWQTTDAMQMQAMNLNCWHAGAKASYAYSSLLDISAGIELAGSNDKLRNFAWYQWRDWGKIRFTSCLAVHPVEKLDIAVEYRLVPKRESYDTLLMLPSGSATDLGKISDLRLRASYGIKPWLTVYANIENILNQKYLLSNWLPSQGLTGLVGLSLKF